MASLFRSALLCGCALLLAAGAAWAQGYPSRPVNLMVPYPPGGPSDAVARIFAPALAKALGQSVVVENLGGASGTVAAQKVLSTPADGYNVFQGSPNELILAPMVTGARLKAEDFRLVQAVGDGVMVFVARKDLPANSVDELVALARKSADRPLNYGSVGVGSLYHLILEKAQQEAGIQMTHVPYKGNTPLVQDLASGQVDFAVLVYNAAMAALVEQGRLKILGQIGAERSELLKDVPTASEGKELKNLVFRIWSGLLVSRNTPEDVVQKLHQAIGASLRDPRMREQLAAQTQMPAAPATLAESTRFYEAEIARYREIARSIRLQPQ